MKDVVIQHSHPTLQAIKTAAHSVHIFQQISATLMFIFYYNKGTIDGNKKYSWPQLPPRYSPRYTVMTV